MSISAPQLCYADLKSQTPSFSCLSRFIAKHSLLLMVAVLVSTSALPARAEDIQMLPPQDSVGTLCGSANQILTYDPTVPSGHSAIKCIPATGDAAGTLTAPTVNTNTVNSNTVNSSTLSASSTAFGVGGTATSSTFIAANGLAAAPNCGSNEALTKNADGVSYGCVSITSIQGVPLTAEQCDSTHMTYWNGTSFICQAISFPPQPAAAPIPPICQGVDYALHFDGVNYSCESVRPIAPPPICQGVDYALHFDGVKYSCDSVRPIAPPPICQGSNYALQFDGVKYSCGRIGN